MKIISYGKQKKKRKWKVFAVLLVFIIPFIFPVYALLCFDSLQKFADEVTRAEVDYDSLIPANYTRLSEMADEFQFYMDRDHLPLNYTLSVYWQDVPSYTQIRYYIVAGDAAIWTGMTLAMASLRYAVMKRDGSASEIQDALDFVKNLTSGVSLLLAVPNGGIGPDYPGVLARSVSPKNWYPSNPRISGYDYTNGADNVDVFDGRGDYSDWLFIGYPSLDQYSGIIMGVTMAAALVDDPWVQEQVGLLAAQMIEHFRTTNWHLTDADGRTTGQSMLYKVEHPSFWVLSTIFMGVMADPDAYMPLYHHYAFERNYAHQVPLSAIDFNFLTLSNYFSININIVILYAMMMLETNPRLREVYESTLQSIYSWLRNHRNAWFNMMYLQSMGINDSNIKKDVEDQLMRFDVERIVGDPNSRRLPERGLSLSGGTYDDLIPSSLPRITYDGWLATQPFYPSQDLNLVSLFVEMDDEYLTKPKTVEHYHTVDFLWQRSPYRIITYSPAARQDSGLAFLLPYYMGRYHGIIQEGS
ncbi:MAG: hypothetical protein ACFFCS_20610 [Candidatus Hodarchaeota archaeon]